MVCIRSGATNLWHDDDKALLLIQLLVCRVTKPLILYCAIGIKKVRSPEQINWVNKVCLLNYD